MNIRSESLMTFAGTGRTLARTTQAGETLANSANGQVSIPFGASAAMLADEALSTIVGPTDLQGARDLATQILNGDQRAATRPQSLMLLATCLLVYTQDNDQTGAAVEAETGGDGAQN